LRRDEETIFRAPDIDASFIVHCPCDMVRNPDFRNILKEVIFDYSRFLITIPQS
jgi:hypothetical protein